MKVVVITGEKQCSIEERPEPKIAEDYVKVRIQSIPLCTQFKLYSRGAVNDELGYEAVGEVVEVAQPGAVKVGDRVVAMPMNPCGKCWLCLSGEYIHCQNRVDTRSVCGTETGTATHRQLR